MEVKEQIQANISSSLYKNVKEEEILNLAKLLTKNPTLRKLKSTLMIKDQQTSEVTLSTTDQNKEIEGLDQHKVEHSRKKNPQPD